MQLNEESHASLDGRGRIIDEDIWIVLLLYIFSYLMAVQGQFLAAKELWEFLNAVPTLV